MIHVSWSDELQLNYDDCVKLMKVKKIHNFMLTDFREIISQHHNIYSTLTPDTERCPRTPACVFVQIYQAGCLLVICNWFNMSQSFNSFIPGFREWFIGPDFSDVVHLKSFLITGLAEFFTLIMITRTIMTVSLSAQRPRTNISYGKNPW